MHGFISVWNRLHLRLSYGAERMCYNRDVATEDIHSLCPPYSVNRRASARNPQISSQCLHRQSTSHAAHPFGSARHKQAASTLAFVIHNHHWAAHRSEFPQHLRVWRTPGCGPSQQAGRVFLYEARVNSPSKTIAPPIENYKLLPHHRRPNIAQHECRARGLPPRCDCRHRVAFFTLGTLRATPISKLASRA